MTVYFNFISKSFPKKLCRFAFLPPRCQSSSCSTSLSTLGIVNFEILAVLVRVLIYLIVI